MENWTTTAGQLDKSTRHPHPNSTSFPYPTAVPAIPATVQLGITIAFTALYGILFLIVFIQLWLILYYRYKRLSFQTVFLFLCLIWAVLRLTLFSFYFEDCACANTLPLIPYWLLYCLPVCLQFSTLCLLVLFFAQVTFKAKSRAEYKRKNKLITRLLLGAAVLIFFATNAASAVLIKQHPFEEVPYYLLVTRVTINDVLFVACGVALSVFLFRLTRFSSSASLILEAKGTTCLQASLISFTIVFLYTSRSVYNFVAISFAKIPNFGYDWINVSDQADLVDLTQGYKYLAFGVVLFVWELLPTSVVVFFFRVKRPQNSSSELAKSYMSSRSYFDRPQQEDSENDLSASQQQLLASQTSNAINFHQSSINYGNSFVNYGSVGPSSFRANNIAGTTPPQASPSRRSVPNLSTLR